MGEPYAREWSAPLPIRLKKPLTRCRFDFVDDVDEFVDVLVLEMFDVEVVRDDGVGFVVTGSYARPACIW